MAGDCAEGFAGEWTCYNMDFENVDYDGSEVTVEVHIYRDGDSLIVTQGELNMFINGSFVDGMTGVAPQSAGSTGVGSMYELSGPAQSGDNIQVDFRSPNWSELDTLTETGSVPAAPADIQITDIRVTPANSVLEETVTINITAQNFGGQSGEASFDVLVDGNVLRHGFGFSLSAGQTKTVSTDWSPVSAGDHVIECGGESVVATTYDLQQEVSVDSYNVNPGTDQLESILTVSNTSPLNASVDVQVSIDGSDEKTITEVVGDNETVEFSYTRRFDITPGQSDQHQACMDIVSISET